VELLQDLPYLNNDSVELQTCLIKTIIKDLVIREEVHFQTQDSRVLIKSLEINEKP
jgi:hypothetical protein